MQLIIFANAMKDEVQLKLLKFIDLIRSDRVSICRTIFFSSKFKQSSKIFEGQILVHFVLKIAVLVQGAFTANTIQFFARR